MGSPRASTRHRAETGVTALTARHLLQRDRDGVRVPGDPAQRRRPVTTTLDMRSGRIDQGRRCSRGLHGPHGPIARKDGSPCHPKPRPCCR